MKLKNVPKHLSNLPLNYQLDSSDVKCIKKYRAEKNRKRRKKNNALRQKLKC